MAVNLSRGRWVNDSSATIEVSAWMNNHMPYGNIYVVTGYIDMEDLEAQFNQIRGF